MELKGWLFRRVGPPCLMVMLPSEQYLKLVLPARRTRARSERGPALEPQRATDAASTATRSILRHLLAFTARAKRETCESAQGSSRENTYLHGQTTHLAREAGCLVPIRSLKARLLPRHYLGPVRLLA